MEMNRDGMFQVFARIDGGFFSPPEANEESLAICDSYEEARRVKLLSPRSCVIRYLGCTGGGD